MMISRIRHTVRAITLILVASIFSTCGDDSTNSKEDRGVFGEMADALTQAEADYLTANDEILASVEYMTPIIGDFLRSTVGLAESGAPQTSCLPAGVGGRTYVINGTPFTSSIDASVPEFTARFRLFKLSASGSPLLNQEIGYIDCTCESLFGPGVSEVLIISDSVVIASMAYLPNGGGRGTATGLMRTPDGSGTLFVHGHFIPDSTITLTFSTPGDIVAGCNSPVESAAMMPTSIGIDSPAGEWQFKASLWTGGDTEVDSGYAINTEGEIGIVACIESGTVDAPVFATPAQHCYPDSGLATLSVNPIEIVAMSDSYRSLRQLWLRARRLIEICRSLVAGTAS